MSAREKCFHDKIVYISFILCIMVIQIHTYNVEMYQLSGRNDFFTGIVIAVENYINKLETVCVPFFFFISGVLFFRTFRWDRMWEKYKSRIRSILIPYILWCTIYYLYFALLTRLPGISHCVNSEMAELSLGEWLQWLGPKSYYTLWFLKELMILILISPVIYVLMKNHGNRKNATGVIVYVILIAVTVLWGINVGFNIYYFGGALLGINYDSLLHDKNKGLSIASTLYVLLYLISLPWQNSNGFVGQIGKLIFIVAVWFALDLILQYKNEPRWWMSITFFVYCIHDLILEALEKIFFVIFGNATLFALVDFICMPMIVFGLCVLLAWILKRYMPWVWKIISGSR